MDEMRDGIFEPNQSVFITNIIIKNVGGIPAPPNVAIQFPTTLSMIDISQNSIYRTSNYINPGFYFIYFSFIILEFYQLINIININNFHLYLF